MKYTDIEKRANYYKLWSFCQSQDICFFTYSERLQCLIMVLVIISLSYGILRVLNDYRNNES